MRKASWVAWGALLVGALLGGCNGDDEPEDGTGGDSSGGRLSGGSASGGKSSGGSASGGRASGGRSSGGRASGGSETGGEAGSMAGGGMGGDDGPPARPNCEDIDSLAVGDEDFSVTVEGFDYCGPIPEAHTCEGKPFPEGTSPAISWEGAPDGTESFAVVFKDIAILAITAPSDAAYNRGYHWAMWDIPASTTALPAELGPGFNSEDVEGALQWANFKDYSFFGPCPNFDPASPTDFEDSYSFVVYALPVAEAEIPAQEPGVSTVRLMDDYFQSIALAVAEYRGTSDAHASEIPDGVLPPTPKPPCPSVGDPPEDCLEKE
jgi:phosphatidylethanolamine-binding protein (PEBP) family uncharacterized protein